MKRIIRIAFFAILLFGLGGSALAQDAPKKDSEGFEPVDGAMMQTGEIHPGVASRRWRLRLHLRRRPRVGGVGGAALAPSRGRKWTS